MNCLICRHHRKHPQKRGGTGKGRGLVEQRIGCVKPVKGWMSPDIMDSYPVYFLPDSIVQPCPNFEMDYDND